MSLRETADGYSGFVAQLNPDWRVVACRDRVQWILQRRGAPGSTRANDWRGRSYCRTRDVLIRCAREYSGTIDPEAFAVLAALPVRIEAVAGADVPPPACIGAVQTCNRSGRRSSSEEST
jgi:hypothetical protein